MADLISKKELSVQIARMGAYDILKSVDLDMLNAFKRMRAAMYRLIRNAPAINAVEVVRCKDCKNRGSIYKCPMRRIVLPVEGAGHCEDFTRDDGYCHCGEKDGDS